MVDVVAGQVIRAMAMLHNGRLGEACAEASGAPSMAGACGLTRLRGTDSGDAGKDVLAPKQPDKPERYLGGTLYALQQGIESGQRQRALSVIVRCSDLASIADQG